MKENGNYELLYIIHPDLEGSLDKVLSKVKSFIEKRDGKITYEEDWGKKKLAYEINKCDVGIYILWYFEAPKEKIASIERDLKIAEEVMRFMILKIEEKKKTIKNEKKEIKKTVEKKSKEAKPVETKETEKERMEKIDEKLGELLDGKENDKKKVAKKEEGGKK